MNRLPATLSCLTRIIDKLYSSVIFYSRIKNINPDYVEFLKPFSNQHQTFLNKILNEYERLSKQEYSISGNIAGYAVHNNNISILYESLKIQEQLIVLYSEIIGEDILWEVLPVLAQQLMVLKSSKDMLLNYIEKYKKQHSSIKIEYSGQPNFVN